MKNKTVTSANGVELTRYVWCVDDRISLGLEIYGDACDPSDLRWMGLKLLKWARKLEAANAVER